MPWHYLKAFDGKACHERPYEESRTGAGIWNPIYPPVCQLLKEQGIDCSDKATKQLDNRDYEKYDLLIRMDQQNLRNMYRICSGDFIDKMHLLMDFTDHPGNVSDPWYTRDFKVTWQDVTEGCQGLLEFLLNK